METSKSNKKHSLRPVSDVMKASWERVKAVWPKLLILSVVLLGISFLVGLVFGGTLAGTFFGSGREISSQFIASAVVSGVVFGVVMTAIGVIYGISMMLAVAEVKDNPSLGSLLSRSAKLFVPVFLTALITFFLVYGGMFLLVIPGIVIAILSSFAMYEVVFGKAKYVQAIKNSVSIISQNFWELVKRVLVIIGIAIGLMIINGILTGMAGESSGAQGAISLLWMAVQAVFSWFTIAYYYETYVEARKLSDLDKKKSITWMWVVAAIGWVVGIFVLSIASRAISEVMNNPELLNGDYQYDMEQQLDGSAGTEELPAMDADQLIEMYGQDMTEEEKEALRQMMQETTEMMEETEQSGSETEGAL